jgi:acyl-CoA synthetase (AMP-forming)/AMP-acid ligase II
MMTAISSRHSQQGVALIVTLVILLIVTFMGLVAMRSGMLQVSMATNSQVSSLVFQSADAGNSAVYAAMTATDPTVDMKNPANLAREAAGQELVNCLSSTGFDATATIATPKRCDPSKNFVSGRGAVMVQTAIKVPLDTSGNAQTIANYGTDSSVLPGGGALLIASYATAVMPNYGAATAAQITECLKLPQDGAGTTITDCLTDKHASFETLVQEFAFGYAGYKK